MTDTTAAWYLPGDDDRPAGPYTTDQILAWVTNDEMDDGALCWREGLADWQPVNQTEPFASAIARARAAERRRGRRVVAGLAVFALLLAAGLTAWVLLTDPPEIARARRLIETGQHRTAEQELASFVDDHPEDDRGLYWLAVAQVHRITAAGQTGGGFGLVTAPDTAETAALFNRAFQADPQWKQQAGRELARVTADLRGTGAPGAMATVLAIARLRADVGVADEAALARELIDALAASLDSQTRLRPGELDAALQVLSWEAGLAAELGAAVLPGREGPFDYLEARVRTLLQGSLQKPAVAAPVAELLLATADRYAGAQRFDQADILFSSAAAVSSDHAEEALTRRLACLRRRLTGGDADGTVRALDRITPQSPQAVSEAAALYLEAATLLRGDHQDRARHAMSKAFAVDPQAPDTEERLLLWIELAERPDAEKLERCRSFLADHPRSRYRGAILGVILSDAIDVYEATDRHDADMVRAYVRAAEESAYELLLVAADTPHLDENVLALADALAGIGHPDKAARLVTDLLRRVPHTPLAEDIDRAIADWQRSPEDEPPQERPSSSEPQDETPEESEPTGTPVLITSAQELTAFLNDGQGIAVAWVRLRKGEVEDAAVVRLMEWVRTGGVLWVDTDLARSLGFSRVGRTPTGYQGGQATVRVPRRGHPILEGLAQDTRVGYTLSRQRSVLYDSARRPAGDVVALLVDLPWSKNRARMAVICGVRPEGKGLIIFRPERFDTGSPAGLRFERNLRRYSFLHSSRPADEGNEETP